MIENFFLLIFLTILSIYLFKKLDVVTLAKKLKDNYKKYFYILKELNKNEEIEMKELLKILKVIILNSLILIFKFFLIISPLLIYYIS